MLHSQVFSVSRHVSRFSLGTGAYRRIVGAIVADSEENG
jgi:hypothetical protein